MAQDEQMTTAFYGPTELIEWFGKMADLMDRSRSWLIVQALQEYRDRRKTEQPPAPTNGKAD